MVTDNKYKEIHGSEGIVVHNGNVVLGLQKEKRWYHLLDHKKVGIIKTIGGAIEEEDKGSSREALKRELQEEIKDLDSSSMRITSKPIFHKSLKMGQMNRYERRSDLQMNADFYVVEIKKEDSLEPNDLPAIIEIPVEGFLSLMSKQGDIDFSDVRDYIIKNKDRDVELPERYTLMIPDEVRELFIELNRKIPSNKEEVER